MKFSRSAKTIDEKKVKMLKKSLKLSDCQPAYSILNLNIHVAIIDTNQSMNFDDSKRCSTVIINGTKKILGIE